MTEKETWTNSQSDQNYNLLNDSELGPVLGRAYQAAVNLDPRLADIKLSALPPDNEKTAFAVAGWSKHSASGKHEVHVRLSDLDSILERYAEDLAKQPAAREALAELLDLEADEVTPQVAYIFSLLHEMGHVTEFYEYEDNPDAFRSYIKKNRSAMPLGWASTKDILDPDSVVGKKIAANRDLVFGHFKVDDLHGLVQIQSRAYRQMPHEKHADNFAVEVFEMNPMLKSEVKHLT